MKQKYLQRGAFDLAIIPFYLPIFPFIKQTLIELMLITE